MTTDFVAISINSMKTSSEKGRTKVDGPRYRKSAHKDIVLSKGMLVNNETISKETISWDSLHKGSRRIIEENVKESLHKTQNRNLRLG